MGWPGMVGAQCEIFFWGDPNSLPGTPSLGAIMCLAVPSA
uniref:Uncharacterized protein n=1 Tax=Anguilla anguilla TaxID=7936 RepID=A0A0E9R5A8_ANGAN